MFKKVTLHLLFIFIILVTFATQAYAAQSIWPTDLLSYGDCLSARISAPMNKMQTKVDALYCSNENAGDPSKIEICKTNSAYKAEIVFFNDLCELNVTGKAYISINGKEYTLRQTSKPSSSPMYFEGTYQGNGIKVIVGKGKLIKNEETPSEDNDPKLNYTKFNVTVTVFIGQEKQRIDGVFTPSGP